MNSINSQPTDFTTMFLDMNSFFASVEQQVRPELRGLPVGITPYVGGTGCIIAASREAKNYGIKAGCLVKEARQIYPKIKIIESRPALYMIYHKEIKKIIANFTPYFQPLSIDEFIIHLDSREQNREVALEIGRKIKSAILTEVGDFLTCSVGIGPNRFLAKMAGERKKPDGLEIVELSKLEEFYAPLKLTDLTGINFRLESRLKKFGINSPSELYRCNLARLRAILGHGGRLWYYRLRGFEVDDYNSSQKTVGHSHVLPPEFRNRAGAEGVIRKLIYKAGSRLRKEGFQAGGVSITIGFYNASGFHQSKKVAKFSDTATFVQHIFDLLKNCHWHNNPSYVAVSAFNLSSSKDLQMSVFEDIEKSRRLSEACDKIDDDFGMGFIHPASAFIAKDTAPDRIPFGKPRYDIRNG